jgi:tetratricopeptide (TPR) repeat protein
LPRLIDAAVGVWYFATQAFFVPINRTPAILDFTRPQPDRALWYAVLACNCVVLAWLIRRRRSVETVGFLWWLVSLIPSAAVTLTPGVWPGLNRWLYAGTPGLLLTISGVLIPRLRGRAPAIAWGGLCVLLTVLSVRAGRVFKNDVALFSAMVSETPDHFWSYRRLGWALYYRARFSEAIPVLQKGAELAPDDERDSCYGLQAAAMAGAGDCDGAVRLYRAHLPTPMMDVGHFLTVVGACYERLGNVARALDLFRACGTQDARCRAAVERLTRAGDRPAPRDPTIPL